MWNRLSVDICNTIPSFSILDKKTRTKIVKLKYTELILKANYIDDSNKETKHNQNCNYLFIYIKITYRNQNFIFKWWPPFTIDVRWHSLGLDPCKCDCVQWFSLTITPYHFSLNRKMINWSWSYEFIVFPRVQIPVFLINQ